MRYLRKRFIIAYVYILAGIIFAYPAFLTKDDILIVMCAIGSLWCLSCGILIFIIKTQDTNGLLPDDIVYYLPNYKAECSSVFKIEAPKADNLEIDQAYIVEVVEGSLIRLKGCKFYHHVSQFYKSTWHHDSKNYN